MIPDSSFDFNPKPEPLRSRLMNRLGTFRQQVTVWAFVLGLWLLLVLAFAGQVVLTAENVDWTQALRRSVHEWFPWALLSPAVVLISSYFPLERGKLLLSVPVHILACVGALFFCHWLSPRPPDFRQFPGGRPPQPFRNQQDDRPPFRNPDNEGPPFRPGMRPPPGGNRPPFDPEQRPGDRQRQFGGPFALRARANIPIYFVLVSLVHALTFYRRSQDRERRAVELERRLTDAKLEALRSQLHPHFLFNTLNAISTLVHRDAKAADEMITNLSELLRAALDTSEQEIPLGRELDFLNHYLEIQQVRFADRLQIHKEIDALALDGLVPTLILQPLAENAIRHGIEPQTGAGLVHIAARRQGDVLRLTMRDSGSGPKQSTKEPSGIGLANTRARLQELYGDRARLTLTSGAEGGFTVEIEIPYHEQSATQQSKAAGSNV